MKWISVKDRLPEVVDHGPQSNVYSDDVLAFDGEHIFIACRFKDVRGYTKTSGQIIFVPTLYDEDWDMGEITHWMPLPKAPK